VKSNFEKSKNLAPSLLFKRGFVALALGSILAAGAFAQTDNTNDNEDNEMIRKFSFQMNPLLIVTDIIQLSISNDVYGFLLGFEFQYNLNKYLNLTIEPRFGMWKGVSFGYGYGSNDTSLKGWGENEEYTYVSLNPGLLIMPLATSLKGWYIGIYPTLGWKNIK